ncbi:hypothetical protein [Brevundimonas naejangsanensis]
MFPAVGESGEFRMWMYRGISGRRNHPDFASDPGDYGRGEYWVCTREHAEGYAQHGGEVIEGEIHLKNALHLSVSDIVERAKHYGTTIGARHNRLAASERLTRDMQAQGHDGIVSNGYEDFTSWSACVFPIEPPVEPTESTPDKAA